MFLDARNDAIIAYAITPITVQVTAQRMPETPGILCGRETLAQITCEEFPGDCTEPLQFAIRFRFEFNAPSQGVAPLLRG